MPFPRKLPADQRADVVLQLLAGTPPAELCRRHQISLTTLNRWRDEFIQAGKVGLRSKNDAGPDEALREEAQQLRELVGDLALANYALKKGRARSAGGRP